MAYAISTKDLDQGDPTPTQITPDAMRSKLQAAGIHANSPLGRGILVIGNVLVDDDNEYFITTQQSTHEPEDQRAPVSRAPNAPATRETNMDKVARAMGLTK